MQSLKVKKVHLAEAGVDFRELTKGFVSIRVRHLFPDSTLPCDLYFPFLHGTHSLSLERAIAKGGHFSAEFHAKLQRYEIRIGYIRREEEASFAEYFDSQLQQVIRSPSMPTEAKTQLIYDDAEQIVKRVLRDQPNQSNLALGQRFVNHFSAHLAADDVSADALMAIFSKDYYTFTHSVQVSLLGMAFCRFLGWEDDTIKSFGLGALFHDVGKSLIDEAILNKPGKLHPDEFNVMKTHPSLGYEQIKQTQVLTAEQLSIVLHHHEAMDGSGYPDGLEGQGISPFARVARIADCFDALTSNRPYKSALPTVKAVGIMRDEMGHTFDRELLKRFAQFLGLDESAWELSKPRLQVELGVKVLIELDDQADKLNGLLVGMEADRYLVLRVPALAAAQTHIQPGKRAVCRYVCQGNVVQFRSTILGHVLDPLKLLLVRFPSGFKLLNLRKHPRIDCFLPATVGTEDTTYQGVLLDISVGGCKFALKKSTGTSPQVPVGASITILATLFGEQNPLPFPGLVRHVEADRERVILGIEFNSLSGLSHQKLSTYLENMLTLVQ